MSQIRLFIYTGSQEQGLNPVPVVSAGSMPRGFVPVQPCLVDEDEVWVLKHTNDYNLYAAFSKKYLTKENTPGILLVAVVIPADQQLDGGKSTLTLIESITDCFTVQCLDGKFLPDKPCDNSPFIKMLERYALVRRPFLLPIMNGHQEAAWQLKNTTQLDAIMRYSNYPELAQVSQLEMGFKCMTTINLKGLSLPTRQTPPPQPKDIIGSSKESVQSYTVTDADQGKQQGKKKNKVLFAVLIAACFLVLVALSFICVNAFHNENPITAPLDTTDITQNPEMPLKEKKDTMNITGEEKPIPATMPGPNQDKTTSHNPLPPRPVITDEDVDTVRKVKKPKAEEEKTKAEAEKAKAQQMAAEQKEKTHREVLALVQKGDFNGCKKHPGWMTYLSADERAAVEAVLYQKDNPIFSRATRKKIKNYLKEKSFSSWPALNAAKQEIDRIIKEDE